MRKHKIVVKKAGCSRLKVKTADGSEMTMTEIECAAYIGATFGASLHELNMRANEWVLKVKMY